MERCIVAPVDGSPFGEHALPLAAALARRLGTVLHLAHVHVPLIAPSGVEVVAFQGSWNEVARRQEREYLRDLVERISERHEVRVDSSLVEGPVAPALEGFVRGCGAGLVVMSTHAHVRLRRLWHHGVAEHIARELPLPVLLVRPAEDGAGPDLDAAPEIRRILIPLDGSRHAEEMVQRAAALGRPLGARYTLLRVIRPDLTIGYSMLAQDAHVNHHRLDAERTAALQYLNSVAERMRAGRLEVETRVVASEDAAGAITRFAAAPENAVDLIALESHPHRAVARILGAHTADLVVRDAPVPVLLFEPAAEAASAARARTGEVVIPSPLA